ncbi:hypothetical protein [Microcystis sp. M169S2]|uniref:hypothetical protein n=1 Tax=Microcystis sp. M169S2 TaxID=2771157 RepID=UPI00258EC14A|nr:hypothetical protein [Microcystis sp. M169S2]
MATSKPVKPHTPHPTPCPHRKTFSADPIYTETDQAESRWTVSLPHQYNRK